MESLSKLKDACGGNRRFVALHCYLCFGQEMQAEVSKKSYVQLAYRLFLASLQRNLCMQPLGPKMVKCFSSRERFFLLKENRTLQVVPHEGVVPFLPGSFGCCALHCHAQGHEHLSDFHCGPAAKNACRASTRLACKIGRLP